VEESDSRSFLQEDTARRLYHLWKLGQRPDVNRFIAEVAPLSSVQLVAVLRVDQAERWQAGERVPVESYLMRFPTVADLALDLIYGECLIREEMGETLSLPEYQQRFPQFAASVTALGAPTAARQRSRRQRGSYQCPGEGIHNVQTKRLRRELDGRADVQFGEVRVIAEEILDLVTVGKFLKDQFHADPGASNDRLSEQNLRVTNDAGFGHLITLVVRGQRR